MEASTLHSETIHEQQRSVFNMLLLLTFVAGIFFFSVNIYRGVYLIAIAEILMSLFSLWLFFKLKNIVNYHKFQKISLAYLVLFYTIMLFVMWQKESSIAVFVWVFLMPILSYFMLGKKLGAYVTTFFVLSAFIIFFIHFRRNASLLQFIAFANIFVCAITIWFISDAYEKTNIEIKNTLATMAVQDVLTGSFNRNALYAFYAQYNKSSLLSVVLFDIDWFKKINDSYGHDAGDITLKVVSKKLETFFADIGYVFRIGGEEFFVLCPDVSIEKATKLTQDFLKEIVNVDIIFEDTALNVTLSAGIAEYPKEKNAFDELQKLADVRLYQAKELGRNQAVYQ